MNETNNHTVAGSGRSVRCGVDVVAGLLPGVPIPEHTRQWFITSEEWDTTDDKTHLLSDLAGKAAAWQTYLMFQPDRFNWIKTEWVWF